MKKYLGIVCLVIIGLSACTSETPAPTEPTACPAEEFSRHLWQPATFLNGIDLPEGARVIRPGMAVTMDFRPDRLNIEIGKSNRIERVYCG